MDRYSLHSNSSTLAYHYHIPLEERHGHGNWEHDNPFTELSMVWIGWATHSLTHLLV